jgi:large subunit ribosomal protein L3
MGMQRTTVKNLKIVDVRPDLGVIAIQGAVPGSRNTIVEISKD